MEARTACFSVSKRGSLRPTEKGGRARTVLEFETVWASAPRTEAWMR